MPTNTPPVGSEVPVSAEIAIGSAQFGMPYGVANRDGPPNDAEIAGILHTAERAGMRYIDTAAAYGRSEEALGAHSAALGSFRVVTKIRPIGDDESLLESAQDSVRRSFERLGSSSIYGLLAHRSSNLLCDGGDAVWAHMEQLRADGSVHRIGATVYEPEEAVALMERYPISLIQVPAGILDQRFTNSGLIAEMRRRDIEIHIRSVFLQGLVFFNDDNLPRRFDPIRDHLAAARQRAKEHGVALHELALWWARERSGGDVVVLGVERSSQVEQNAEAARQTISGAGDLSDLSIADAAWRNPANWPA